MYGLVLFGAAGASSMAVNFSLGIGMSYCQTFKLICCTMLGSVELSYQTLEIFINQGQKLSVLSMSILIFFKCY